MIYLPNQKPPIWSIDPGIVAYNYQKHGFPHPVLDMPMWVGAGNRALDLSGHGNHGAITGAVRVNGDLYFDGNDYINIDESNNDINTTAGTIVSVFTPSDWGDASAAVLISYRVDGNNNIEFYHEDWDSLIRLKYKAGGIAKEATNTLIKNILYHAVLTWDKTADEVKGYIDGSQIGATLNGLGNWAGSITIGKIGAARTPAQNFYEGSKKSTIIFPTALSAAQVKFLHENPYFMYQIPEELYGYVAGAPPPASIINQFMRSNLGSDLYNGVLQ